LKEIYKRDKKHEELAILKSILCHDLDMSEDKKKQAEKKEQVLWKLYFINYFEKLSIVAFL